MDFANGVIRTFDATYKARSKLTSLDLLNIGKEAQTAGYLDGSVKWLIAALDRAKEENQHDRCLSKLRSVSEKVCCYSETPLETFTFAGDLFEKQRNIMMKYFGQWTPVALVYIHISLTNSLTFLEMEQQSKKKSFKKTSSFSMKDLITWLPAFRIPFLWIILRLTNFFIF